LFAVPLLGYGLRIFVGILKLPRMAHHLRRLDCETRRSAAEIQEYQRRLDSETRRVAAEIQEYQLRVDLETRRADAEIQEYQLATQEYQLATSEHLARIDVVLAQFPRLAEAVTVSQTAVRAMQRAALKPIEVAASGSPLGLLMDPQIEVVPELLLRRDPPRGFNRLPRMTDWAVDSPLSRRMTELREPHTMHRKQWEYAICLEGLQAMGVVNPKASAIAVGAGSERPLYYYANEIARMVATDLYDNPKHEGQPAMLTDPARFAPFPYREDRLEVLRMPGDALDFADSNFDFAFCLSSIEHFGSRATQRKALDEMARVVRPGGAVCIITELILNGERHSEYFMPSEVQDMFLQHPTLRLEGAGPEWRISDLSLACPVDIRVQGDLTTAPHLVLYDGRVLWTSASLFFRKQA
jgi:SAM-dependent methyltransferase